MEVTGGYISWTKPADVNTNVRASCRRLAGASIRISSEDSRIGKLSSDLHVFIVYFAYDMREFKVAPLILATESEQDMNMWVIAINQASRWMYHPPSLNPLPRRLCGLIVLQILSVENVVPADWSGKSDPYVLVLFNGLLARTAVQYRALSAEFDDFIVLPVYNDDPNSTIQLIVFDQDEYSDDEVLGIVSIPLHAVGFNKEIVWDSLPLRPTKNSIVSRSSATADRYGTISFRTLYRSSRATQFLPAKQTPAVDDGATTGHVEAYTQNLEKSLTQAGLSQLSEQGSEDGTTVVSSPKQGGSPKSPSSQPTKQEEDEFAYDFSIEMFKAQLVRILEIIKIFSIFKFFGHIVAWRDPRWTLTLYVWFSWVCLVEPQSALMFWVICLLRLLLMAHPCYPDFKAELRARWQTSTKKTMQDEPPKLMREISADSSPRASTARDFRVFECQRRKMAGAITVISTMVKMPAQVALNVVRSKDDPSSPKMTREIEDLFVKFSAKNLRVNEHEWVSPTGAALKESPSTVIDGMKIKWSVQVNRKKTDKNGWEYAKNFPYLGSGECILFDPREHVLWGAGHKWERKLGIRKHWVRRRVWVGTAVRPALSSEEPVKLSQIVESAVGGPQDQLVETKQKQSLFARFKQLMEEGRKLQTVLFGIATKLESIKNLFSWKARWISSLIFWVLIVILFSLTFVSQFVVVWVIFSAIIAEALVNVLKLERLTLPLVEELQRQLEEQESIPHQWRVWMKKSLTSYFSNMHEVLTEVPVSIVCSLFQKACDAVWFPNAVQLGLEDFDATDESLTLGMILEKIYLSAHSGDADWWKSVQVGIHPKNLIKGHLVSDWEMYNPSSVFAKRRGDVN